MKLKNILFKNTKIPSTQKGKIHNVWYSIKNYQIWKSLKMRGEKLINRNKPRNDVDNKIN